MTTSHSVLRRITGVVQRGTAPAEQLAEYANAISFRVLQPEKASYPRWYLSFCNLIHRDPEFWNVRLPLGERHTKNQIRRFFFTTPKMSTLAIGAIINFGVQIMPRDQVFVNVGIWNGYSLLCAMLNNDDKTCIGIDNFSQFGGPREDFLARFNEFRGERDRFFEMDYRDYFANEHKGPVGFYIYDGEHSYDNQLMGLQVAEPFLADGCIVLVDDTDWDEPRRATLDFMAQSQHRYELIFERRTRGNNHPTFWNGIMLLRKVC